VHRSRARSDRPNGEAVRILLDPTTLVSTIADSLASQLRAKAQCELPPKVLLDVARNVAQAVMGLGVLETVVVETKEVR